jgi:hypothetical protein
MKREIFQSPETLKPAIEVWILCIHRDLQRHLEIEIIRASHQLKLPVNFKKFFMAEKVLDEFNTALAEKNPLPDIVVIDNSSGLTSENLGSTILGGLESIRAIAYYCQKNQIDRPFLLGTSEGMEDIGANATFDINLPIEERIAALEAIFNNILERKQ